MSQKYQSTIKLAISILVGLFPILSIAVKDGGSATFLLLFLMGMVFGWPAWKKISLSEKQWLWSLLVFALVIMLSFLVNANWSAGYSKIERFARLVGLIPIYLLFRRFNPELLKPLLFGSALAVVILFYQSITLFGVGDYGVSGIYYRIFFGDSVVLLTLWLALGLWLLSRDKRILVVGSIIVAMGLYATTVSMCRNAWLFIPLLAPVMLFLFRKRLTLAQIGKFSAAIVAVSAVLVIWTPPSVEKGIEWGVDSVENFVASSDTDSSLAARIKLWHDSLIMAERNPLLGVGIGNFKSARQTMMNNGETFHGKPYGHAHNIFLHALATTGLLGLISLTIALFVMPWRLLYSEWLTFPADPWLRFSLIAGLLNLVAFAHFGLTEAWTMRNPFINFYVLFTALFVAATLNRLPSEKETVSEAIQREQSTSDIAQQQKPHNT